MASSYSKLEKNIAHLLSNFPYLKRGAKLAYQYFNYLIYKKSYKKKSELEVISVINSNSESFFGYYDKLPFNINGYILYHQTNYSTAKKPNPENSVQIVLNKQYDNNEPKVIAESKAYNWQQGTRLQWLNEKFFIFNDFDENEKQYTSRVFSISVNKEIKRFNLPIEDAFKSDYFLSLNFRRLQTLRPDYGYQNLPPLNNNELQNLENDGIWHVNYKNNESKLLISLKDIVNIKYKKRFKNADHYINHIMISPNGERFIFLHRYFKKGKRFDRLLISDRYGNEIKVLADYEMVSHCYWIDNNNIIGYLNNDKKEAGFYLINVNTGEFINYADGRLDAQGDGHPNVSGKWFVCDSYPDKSRMQHLTLNNLETGKSINLGEFFHGFKYNGETRCDLHPRFSHDGKKVFFDSVFDGNRNMYMLNLVK
jgi:hypothetical protein